MRALLLIPYCSFLGVVETSLAARYLEKKSRLVFDFFHAPPFLFPRIYPRMTRRLIKTSAPDLKLGWLKLLAGFTRKKASTRLVNKKIADSTRNQRVFFSRYLAANYVPTRVQNRTAVAMLGSPSPCLSLSAAISALTAVYPHRCNTIARNSRAIVLPQCGAMHRWWEVMNRWLICARKPCNARIILWRQRSPSPCLSLSADISAFASFCWYYYRVILTKNRPPRFSYTPVYLIVEAHGITAAIVVYRYVHMYILYWFYIRYDRQLRPQSVFSNSTYTDVYTRTAAAMLGSPSPCLSLSATISALANFCCSNYQIVLTKLDHRLFRIHGVNPRLL